MSDDRRHNPGSASSGRSRWSRMAFIVVPYVVLASIWIAYSDAFLAGIGADADTLTHLQTLKGSLFVVVTAGLLLLLLNRVLADLEREHAHAAASESAAINAHNLFSAAFQSSRVAALITRLEDGAVIAANDRLVEETGWTAGEMIGKTAFELGLWGNPEERQPLIERLHRDGHVDEYELQTRDSRGKARWISLSAVIVMIGGGAAHPVAHDGNHRAQACGSRSRALPRAFPHCFPCGACCGNHHAHAGRHDHRRQ